MVARYSSMTTDEHSDWYDYNLEFPWRMCRRKENQTVPTTPSIDVAFIIQNCLRSLRFYFLNTQFTNKFQSWFSIPLDTSVSPTLFESIRLQHLERIIYINYHEFSLNRTGIWYHLIKAISIKLFSLTVSHTNSFEHVTHLNVREFDSNPMSNSK